MRAARPFRVALVAAVAHAVVLAGMLPPAVGAPVPTASATSRAAVHAGVLRADRGSVPDAGWFHLAGPQLPAGTAYLRYRNVADAAQVGIARHGAGPLSFWLRAPGAPGSLVTLGIEALDGMGAVLADLGTLTLRTGDAPLPLPEGTGSGRRIVLDAAAQQVWWVAADGTVAGTALLSGRRIPTASGADQPGIFRVYSKSRHMRYCEERCGTAEFMVRYQRTPRSAVGLHSLPMEGGRPVQTAADLGWPLSHGCSRLEDASAEALYRWSRIGDPVVVIDSGVRNDAVREVLVESSPPIPHMFGDEPVEVPARGTFTRLRGLLAGFARRWS